MNQKVNIRKISIIVSVIYLVIGVAFYFIGGEQIQYIESKKSIVSPVSNSNLGPILKGKEIEQDFSIDADAIGKVNLVVTTFGRQNEGNIFVSLIDKESGNILSNQKFDVSQFQEYGKLYIDLNEKLNGMRNKTLGIIITSDIDSEEKSPSLYIANSTANLPMYLDGKLSDKSLLISVKGLDRSLFGENYWYVFFIGLIITGIYLLNLTIKDKRNKKCYGLDMINTFYKYKFLFSQLIERDFKTKYKRSVLGVLWSFLNPLLTMSVQYVIFSTIFKSDIPNFPVYLLSGYVLFNFFTEASGMGLMSILGNASLITKVYVPKFIYPVSRVLSSVVNLILALIPLIIVMIVTKNNIGISLLLVPFTIVCTIIFAIGMSLILSSAMVFFRDTQFLWNVVSLLWMYATPLFYPETIIPDKYSFILKLNPMYHFIRFFRTCILNGVSPEPMEYLICIVFSVGTFLIGAFIFKKNEDKFILNL